MVNSPTRCSRVVMSDTDPHAFSKSMFTAPCPCPASHTPMQPLRSPCPLPIDSRAPPITVHSSCGMLPSILLPSLDASGMQCIWGGKCSVCSAMHLVCSVYGVASAACVQRKCDVQSCNACDTCQHFTPQSSHRQNAHGPANRTRGFGEPRSFKSQIQFLLEAKYFPTFFLVY